MQEPSCLLVKGKSNLFIRLLKGDELASGFLFGKNETLLELKKCELQNGVIRQFVSCFAVVCEKSGLACLAEGIGAGAVSFSAHTCCRCGGCSTGLTSRGVPKPGWEGRALLQLTYSLGSQKTPQRIIGKKKTKHVAFIHIISLLVFIQFR